MEYRHVKDVADHRYKAYADWDILDMEEFSQAVFLGAEQADSIQAVVDYNYDLLDAIEVFAPNQMTKERICGALHSSDMEVMVCEPDILKTINLDEVLIQGSDLLRSWVPDMQKRLSEIWNSIFEQINRSWRSE